MNTKKDTASATALYTEESTTEIDEYLKSKKAYVGGDGEFIANLDTDTVKYVLHNLTGTPAV